MRNLKLGDLGLYIVIFTVTIYLFFIPKQLWNKFLWIAIAAILLWIALELCDHVTKARHLKEIVVPRKMFKINNVILKVTVFFCAFCVFCRFRSELSPWMGYVYWLLLGAMITSRIMVGVDWQKLNKTE